VRLREHAGTIGALITPREDGDTWIVVLNGDMVGPWLLRLPVGKQRSIFGIFISYPGISYFSLTSTAVEWWYRGANFLAVSIDYNVILRR
jgi:hypothetical protein